MARLSAHQSFLRHEALRDTHWVGKGVGNPLVLISLIVVAGAVVALLIP